MTVSSLTNRKLQTSNGVQTIFAYDYLILDESHLILYHSDDLDTPLTGFTVTGVGNQGGGTAIFTIAPAVGTIILNREVPLTQTFDYITGGKFPADTHERLADLLVMMAQRLEDESGRTVKLPLDATQTDLVMPSPAAGQTIIGKADESGWEDGPTADEISNAQGYANSASSSALAADGSASSASASASASLVSENKAAKWAEEVEDTEVETGLYSALHHAAKAAASVAAIAVGITITATSSKLTIANTTSTFNNNLVVEGTFTSKGIDDNATAIKLTINNFGIGLGVAPTSIKLLYAVSDLNTPCEFINENTSNGTGAITEVRTVNNTGGGFDLGVTSTGWTADTSLGANEGFLVSESPLAGMHFKSNTIGNSYIRWSMIPTTGGGGVNEMMRLNDEGALCLGHSVAGAGAKGNLILANNTGIMSINGASTTEKLMMYLTPTDRLAIDCNSTIFNVDNTLTSGLAGALIGYWRVRIGGTDRKIPYYAE